MPTTVRPLSAQSAARDLSSGTSRRQGAHQVAQKLMTSDLPLQVEIGTEAPARSLSEKSGRWAGTTGRGMAPSGMSLPGKAESVSAADGCDVTTCGEPRAA